MDNDNDRITAWIAAAVKDVVKNKLPRIKYNYNRRLKYALDSDYADRVRLRNVDRYWQQSPAKRRARIAQVADRRRQRHKDPYRRELELERDAERKRYERCAKRTGIPLQLLAREAKEQQRWEEMYAHAKGNRHGRRQIGKIFGDETDALDDL